ncbi:MAG: AAA family ATPase, partial [Fimbriimonadales bacterium]
TPPPFIGIEEPENYLHPRLLPGLAEECLQAAERTQLLITTHSPYFLNGVRNPKSVQVLWRGEDGFTRIRCVGDIEWVQALANKALLGELWMEGAFLVGDPLEGERVRPTHELL